MGGESEKRNKIEWEENHKREKKTIGKRILESWRNPEVVRSSKRKL